MARQSRRQDVVKRVRQLEEELSNRTRQEQHLRDELERMRSFCALAASLAEGGGLAGTVQLIADKIRELFDADGSCLALFDQTSYGELSVDACSGAVAGSLGGMRLQPDELPARAKMGDGRLFTGSAVDPDGDPIVAQAFQAADSRSAMAVPIAADGDCLGFLYVFGQADHFSRPQLDFLRLIADLASAEIRRARTEHALRESDERFRFMLETTGDVIYRLRYSSMSYDYLSPGIIKLTGYSRDEIQDMGFARLVTRIDTPAQKDVPARSLVKDRQEGKTGEYRADYLIRDKTGNLKWVRDHSFPWRDEAGTVIGSVGILSDIDDYKRIEARIEQRTDELIESEEKYRSLVENVPLVVYRMRCEAEVFFLNQFVEQMFGFSADEILRGPELWLARLYEEDRDRIVRLRQESLREGKEFVAEYRIVHKAGHLVYVLDHAVPFRSADGLISSLDGIIMDMTGRVRLQEQLVRAEELKTVSEVSQRLAHEFRNPLVSAGGFARLLLSSMSRTDPNREKVQIIVQEVGRLEAILRTIISYLQPFELNRSLTDLNDLVESVVGRLGRIIRKRQIRMDLGLVREAPPLWLDQKLAAQALDALIRNAVYQTAEQGTVHIFTRPAGDMTELTIRYPAVHLACDDVEHFFYPFTTSPLGYADSDLPMSKIIVTKHGGQIDVACAGSNEVVVRLRWPARAPAESD